MFRFSSALAISVRCLAILELEILMNRSETRLYPPVVLWKLILWMMPFMFLAYLSVDVTREAFGKTGGCILHFFLVSLYICWVTKLWYLFAPFFISSTAGLWIAVIITGGM